MNISDTDKELIKDIIQRFKNDELTVDEATDAIAPIADRLLEENLKNVIEQFAYIDKGGHYEKSSNTIR